MEMNDFGCGQTKGGKHSIELSRGEYDGFRLRESVLCRPVQVPT